MGDRVGKAASVSTAACLDAPLVTIEKPSLRVPEPWPPGIERGDILLRFTIGADGMTRDVEVVRTTHPVWVEPATSMALATRYSSPMRAGKKVSIRIEQAFTFKTSP